MNYFAEAEAWRVIGAAWEAPIVPWSMENARDCNILYTKFGICNCIWTLWVKNRISLSTRVRMRNTVMSDLKEKGFFAPIGTSRLARATYCLLMAEMCQ